MNPTHHPAFWPYDYRDRVVLGWKGLLVGVLVADVVFFLAGTLPGVFSRPSYASYALNMMGVSMVFGMIPIGAVGLPVGALLGKAFAWRPQPVDSCGCLHCRWSRCRNTGWSHFHRLDHSHFGSHDTPCSARSRGWPTGRLETRPHQ